MILRAWTVEATPEFAAWYVSCSDRQRAAIDAHVRLLGERGPTLGSPYSSDIRGARHGRLRELRIKHGGRPLRAFYAFDPRRHAVLLLGGDKTGDDRFYERMIPIAESLYDRHLERLRGGRQK